MGWSGGGLVGGLLGIQSIRKRLEKERERWKREMGPSPRKRERDLTHTRPRRNQSRPELVCVLFFDSSLAGQRYSSFMYILSRFILRTYDGRNSLYCHMEARSAGCGRLGFVL